MPLWLPSLRVAGETCFPGDPERGCFVQTAGAAVVSMGLAEVLQVKQEYQLIPIDFIFLEVATHDLHL